MEQLQKVVSIVVESSDTDLESSGSSIFDTLDSLSLQDYPTERVEIIVCQHGWEDQKLQTVRRRYPSAKVLSNPEGGYY